MTRTHVLLGVTALAAAGALLISCNSDTLSGSQPPPTTIPPPALVAAAGRVEPVSEEIDISSEVAGRLQQVPIEEGDRIQLGQVLAVVENSDYRAAVALAEARLAARESELRRVVNGARSEERLEAAASLTESQAQLDNSAAELERHRGLFDRGAISRAELERKERDYLVARARVEAARQHKALVEAKARQEDLDRARAEVAAARAQLDLAKALLAKTVIRSPISGVVLRRRLRAGESVVDSPETVIATIANDDVLRVRADVDETDVARIRLGQSAYVTADAYGDRRFQGRVVRIGQILGRKNVYTDAPTERLDAKILETLIELDPGQRLPIGLRVNAYIIVE